MSQAISTLYLTRAIRFALRVNITCGPPYCCEIGEKCGVKVCSSCLEFNNAMSECLGPGPRSESSGSRDLCALS